MTLLIGEDEFSDSFILSAPPQYGILTFALSPAQINDNTIWYN
jgi:hypothetical protein